MLRAQPVAMLSKGNRTLSDNESGSDGSRTRTDTIMKWKRHTVLNKRYTSIPNRKIRKWHIHTERGPQLLAICWSSVSAAIRRFLLLLALQARRQMARICRSCLHTLVFRTHVSSESYSQQVPTRRTAFLSAIILFSKIPCENFFPRRWWWFQDASMSFGLCYSLTGSRGKWLFWVFAYCQFLWWECLIV